MKDENPIVRFAQGLLAVAATAASVLLFQFALLAS